MAMLLMAMVALAIVSCNKNEDPNPNNHRASTGAIPYGTITLLNGTTPTFRWTYTSEDNKLKAIKWELLAGGAPTVTNIDDITYTGDNLTKVVQNYDGGATKTLSYSYNSQGSFLKSTEAVSTNNKVWNVDTEFDTDRRIVQWARYRNTDGNTDALTSRQFTYDANGNVTQVKQIDGSLQTDMTITYDNKENKAYLQPEFLALVFSDFSGTLPMVWAGTAQQVVPLSKNNPVQILRKSTIQDIKITLDYTFDTEGYITKVVEQQYDMLNGGSLTTEKTFEIAIP